MTVGYDARFSDGNFGVWVECRARRAGRRATMLLTKHGAEEVRGER